MSAMEHYHWRQVDCFVKLFKWWQNCDMQKGLPIWVNSGVCIFLLEGIGSITDLCLHQCYFLTDLLLIIYIYSFCSIVFLIFPFCFSESKLHPFLELLFLWSRAVVLNLWGRNPPGGSNIKCSSYQIIYNDS